MSELRDEAHRHAAHRHAASSQRTGTQLEQAQLVLIAAALVVDSVGQQLAVWWLARRPHALGGSFDWKGIE